MIRWYVIRYRIHNHQCIIMPSKCACNVNHKHKEWIFLINIFSLISKYIENIICCEFHQIATHYQSIYMMIYICQFYHAIDNEIHTSHSTKRIERENANQTTNYLQATSINETLERTIWNLHSNDINAY